MSKLNFFSVDVFILNVFFEQHKNFYVMHGQFKHYMQSLFPNMEKLMYFFFFFSEIRRDVKIIKAKVNCKKGVFSSCFLLVVCSLVLLIMFNFT